eukprot:scaffold2795_cov130-Skeletonema_marinoi.AAC.1
MPRAKKEKKSVLGKMREGLNPVRWLGGKMPQMLNKRIGGSCPPQGVGAGVGVDGQGNNGESQRVGRGVGAGQGDDAESKGLEDAVQKSLEAMLQQSVESSRSVNSAGVASQETLLQNLPEGIDCNSNGCEVVPAQNIRPLRVLTATTIHAMASVSWLLLLQRPQQMRRLVSSPTILTQWMTFQW